MSKFLLLATVLAPPLALAAPESSSLLCPGVVAPASSIARSRPDAETRAVRLAVQALLASDPGRVDDRADALARAFARLSADGAPAKSAREACLRALDVLRFGDEALQGTRAMAAWLARVQPRIEGFASVQTETLETIAALSRKQASAGFANQMAIEQRRRVAWDLLLALGALRGFSDEAVAAIDGASAEDKAAMLRSPLLRATPAAAAILARWELGVRWQLAFDRAGAILAQGEDAAAESLKAALRDVSDGPFALSLIGRLGHRNLPARDEALRSAAAFQADLSFGQASAGNSLGLQLARLAHLVWIGLSWDIVDGQREEAPPFLQPASDLLLLISARAAGDAAFARNALAESRVLVLRAGREAEMRAVESYFREHPLARPYGGLAETANAFAPSGSGRATAPPPSPRFADALHPRR